jgi:hypothetical protein
MTTDNMKTSALKITLALAVIASIGSVSIAGPASITAVAKTLPTNTKSALDKNAAATPSFKSEFVVPRKATDGRDPFFPDSTRPYMTDTVVKAAVVATPDVEFTLKGIAGSAESPLAIINTTTFTTGEENEVILKSQRFKVRCVEINMTAGTVLIEYAGSRRQLKLQKY